MQNAENACECVREKMTHIPGKNDTFSEVRRDEELLTLLALNGDASDEQSVAELEWLGKASTRQHTWSR